MTCRESNIFCQVLENETTLCSSKCCCFFFFWNSRCMCKNAWSHYTTLTVKLIRKPLMKTSHPSKPSGSVFEVFIFYHISWFASSCANFSSLTANSGVQLKGPYPYRCSSFTVPPQTTLPCLRSFPVPSPPFPQAITRARCERYPRKSLPPAEQLLLIYVD